MAFINKAEKAQRLVTGRRYANQGNTSNLQSIQAVSDSAEVFTSTFDINTSEIYSQQSLIPTASLPFSGSSQHGYILKTDGTVVTDVPTTSPTPEGSLLRYWYRHRLTETSANDQSVYFFLSPAGAIENAEQFANPSAISPFQQTNFISNKYLSASLVNNKAEVTATELAQGNTAGYDIRVYRLPAGQTDPSGDNGIEIPATQWSFDYKTGVLQFEQSANSFAGTSNQGISIYVTAYQYVGKTLNRTIQDLDNAIANLGPGGGGGGSFISSSNGTTVVSASNDSVTIKVASVNVGGFTSTSASFTIPISSSIGFRGNLTGTASWATVAVSASIMDTTATNASYYPVFVTAAGNQGLNIDTNTLSYNPSTNVLTTTASLAATASNISTAFVGSTVAPNNQILISNGTGQVTGSGNLSFNAGTLTIGNSATDITISPSVFDVSDNTYTFAFGGINNAIQVTNAANPNTGQITFNLSASFTGPTVFSSANNSTFDDQFILLASGSGAAKDSGIVFEDFNIGPFGTGSVLFADTAGTKRLSYKFTGSIDSTGFNPDAFINMTFIQDGTFTNTSIVDQKIGGDTGAGYMFIDSDGNIYIKA